MVIRDAMLTDAAQACAVMRRSITELCIADHANDPAILGRWLANKRPEITREWIASSAGSMLVAVEGDAVLAVGGVFDSGEITLNYVSPDARFRGISKAMLQALEERAKKRGAPCCTLISTQTAYRFYKDAGYVDDDASVNKVGSPAQPMKKDFPSVS